MSDDHDRMLREFEAAFKKLSGMSVKDGAGNESRYGQAYQRLVQAGLKPQIRKKYR